MSEVQELKQTILQGLNAYFPSAEVNLSLGTESEYELMKAAANQRIDARIALRRLVELVEKSDV